MGKIIQKNRATEPIARDDSNSRLRKSRHNSFLLHLRGNNFKARSAPVNTTWFLGFGATFLLLLETITGIFLMVYYAPTPEAAYQSIVRLNTEIPFGWLIRDLHRLGGECMIVVVLVHMVKVFLSQEYTGVKRFTWVTGVSLLLGTLVLAFSGYLLVWDQLSFWAVTIGTSMIDTVPGVGGFFANLLRGGPEFGADGLLRFYQLHVIVVPGIMFFFFAVHYYRYVRLHMRGQNRTPVSKLSHPSGDHSPFLSTLALKEITLSLLSLIVLIAIATFFYDAPLTEHANPNLTPSNSQAPWFFLWLQGLLKLGNSLVMGVLIPLALLLFITFFPYFSTISRWLSIRRYLPVLLMGIITISLMVVSSLGLPGYSIEMHPVNSLLNKHIPEEGKSSFHQLGTVRLDQGVYETTDYTSNISTHNGFNRWFQQFTDEINQLSGHGSIVTPSGMIIVEDWQNDMQRITVRIHWLDDTDSNVPRALERYSYVHHTSTL